MTRFVASLCVLYTATLACAATPDSCVHIKRDMGEEGWNAGSGTVIASQDGKSLILTCAHVVPDDKGTLTVWLKGKEYKAKYLTGSKMTVTEVGAQRIATLDGPDLALLTVDAELPVAKLSNKPVKNGDRVRQWGFAGGHTKHGPFYKEGVVIEQEDVWSTADARRGDSGCALFNDAGEIVGVVHSRSIDEDVPAGLAVPLEDIKLFLKDKASDWNDLKGLKDAD